MLTLESPHFNKMVELGSDGGEAGGTLNFDESNDDDDAYNEALGKRPDLPGLITSSILVRCLITIDRLQEPCRGPLRALSSFQIVNWERLR